MQLLAAGRTLEVIQRRGLWIRVKAGQLEGWVHSEYVVDAALAQTGAEGERDPARVARNATLARDVALLRVQKLETELAALRAGGESGAAAENTTLSARVETLEAELAARPGDEERSVQRAEWLAQHEAAVADLTAEKDDLRQLVAQLRGELGTALAAVGEVADHQTAVDAELRLELKRATTAIAGHQVTIAGLEQRLAAGAAELEQLADSQTESQQLASERLRQQELREQEHSAALAAQLALAQAATAEHDQLIEQQRAASGELTERLSVAEATSEQSAAERDALVARARELEAELTSSDQRLDEGERTIESLLSRLRAAAASNSDLESRVAALAGAAGEREQLELQLTTLEHQLSAARGTVAIRDTSLRAAEATVEQLETRLAGLVAVAGERDQAADRLAELERLLSAERTATEQQTGALAAAEEQLSSAQSMAASDRQAATAETASIAAERDRLAASERQLRAELQAAGERADEQESAATAGLGSLRSELAAVSAERDQTLSDSSRQTAALAELEASLERSSQQLAAVRAKRASGAQESAKELAAARAALDVVRAERDRIATTAEDYAAEGKRYATALFELQDWSDQAEAELTRLGAEAAASKTKRSRRQEPLREELGNVQGELATARTAVEDERQARVSAAAVADQLRVELAEARTRESAFDRRLAETGVEGAGQWQQQAQQAVATVAELRRRLAVTTSELTGLRQRQGSRPELPAAPPSVVAPAEPLAVVTSQDHEPLVQVAEPMPVVSESAVPARERRPDPGLRVVEAVQRWARAWSQQDVSGYLAAYAGDYRPASGLDHGTWAGQRRERLTRPRFIEVELNRMEVNVIDARRASVEFEQSYRSDGFGDRVAKTLELVRVDGAWKIVSEVSR